MRWTAGSIAAAVGGQLVGATAGGSGEVVGAAELAELVNVTGVSIDSRTIRPGELFVAVRAGRDGHDFAAAARSAGAAVLMVERPVRSGGPEVVVDDTGQALLMLGSAARGRLPIPVAGITGSVGKTSTKDLAAAALAAGRRTVASARSFNNELGVPLTLANAPADAEAVVLEMGSRGPGHIALLCRVARPTIGVVTSVAAAHTEMFGDLDGVAAAKAELVESLPPDGTAVLNGDDPRTRAMNARTPAAVILYSTGGDGAPGADVVAERIHLGDDLRTRFDVRSPWGRTSVRLEARGVHQVGNALAALTVAAVVGVDLEAAAAALGHASLSPLRMEVTRTPGGATVINDVYNANPASMAAALRALAAVPANRRVAILGPMAELGDRSPAEHLAAAALASDLGIQVIAIGTGDYGTEPAADHDEVLARLGRLGPDSAILVKASRVAALEVLVARLER